MTLFTDERLPKPLRDAISDLGFTSPTEIQALCAVPALEGQDVIGRAQTGSGKTAAFLIPMLTKLSQDPQATALVLVPTRELASQVNEVFRDLAIRMPGFKSAVLIGGASMRPQVDALRRKPRVIIATPGRLIDHIQCRNADLRNVAVLVLDEADRMLDMGFAPQLNRILPVLPKTRQTMLFSATLPRDIAELARKYLKNPVRIETKDKSVAVSTINQTSRELRQEDKAEALMDEIANCSGSVLVFTRTKNRADRVANGLMRAGHRAERIHGDRSQAQREKALRAFRDGKIPILVATDIAARGLDIDHVALVVNYDLPRAPEDYVHRIGRTGRAGRTGTAVSFLTSEDRKTWKAISRLLSASSGPSKPPVKFK